MIPAVLLDPHHRVGRQPVVRMNHVEMSDVILRLEKVPDERAAHLLNFVHEIAAEIMRTVVIPHTVNPADAAAAVTRAGKDVDFMAATFECRRQFRHVRRNPSQRVGVKRFPGKHRNSHHEPQSRFRL